MEPDFSSVADFGLTPAADLLSLAFADYRVKLVTSKTALNAMARIDSVDFALSRIVWLEGTAVGVALIARRGWTSRLAAMALLPAARRRRVGRALVEKLIAEAKDRGDRHFGLEVIEQNEPALKLYLATGFHRIRRLVAFSGTPPTRNPPVPELTRVDVRAVAAAITAHNPPDWPWQISGETIAQLSPPFVGYQLGEAWLALSNPALPEVTIRSLTAVRGPQRADAVHRLLCAVMAVYPDKTWRVAALWPEENSADFLRVGLARQELSQWQMMHLL